MIEVLAAGAVVAVAVGAAASLSASISLQEEHARRVAVVRNLQENMARLWQLGMNPKTIGDILPLDLVTANSPLQTVLFDYPAIVETGEATVGSTAHPVTVQTALCRATVNIGINASAKEQGAYFEMMVCRPSIK